MNSRNLLEQLKALETDLHRLETRQNRERLEQLLHPAFVEVGRDGRRYTRSEVIGEFAVSGATLEPVWSRHFELAELGPGVVLLTYSSAHEGPNGELTRHTFRSSLWLLDEAGWRMRFHQGTATGGSPEA